MFQLETITVDELKEALGLNNLPTSLFDVVGGLEEIKNDIDGAKEKIEEYKKLHACQCENALT